MDLRAFCEVEFFGRKEKMDKNVIVKEFEYDIEERAKNIVDDAEQTNEDDSDFFKRLLMSKFF